jgi:hypothetical protein
LAPYPFTKQKRATLAERMTDLLNEIAQEEVILRQKVDLKLK